MTESFANSPLAQIDLLQLLAAANSAVTEGNPTAAIALYRAWIAVHLDHPLLHAVLFNLAVLLNGVGERDQAAALFQTSIDRSPDFLPPYINLGTCLEQSGNRGGAILAWQQALGRIPQVTPENIDFKMHAARHIGRVLTEANLDIPAEDALRQCLSVAPNQVDALQHWVNLRQRQFHWDVAQPFPGMTRAHLLKNFSPLSMACYRDDPLWQLAHNAAITRNDMGKPPAPLPTDPAPGRIRIGYLSSDLCEHAIGYLTVGLYGLHDRKKFEIFAYYIGRPAAGDRIQNRVKEGVDHWRDLTALDNEAAARKIAEDRLTILIDVNGHTKDARLGLLARRPAPIIVNWLGFPGSMGSAFHHYIIADEFIIPPEHELYFSEKVMRLPCYQPNDRQRLVSEAPLSRAQFGLPEQAMVYCCFNEPRKITERTWRNWVKILTQVPDSLLWLMVAAVTTQEKLCAMAAQEGIAPERLIFADRLLNPDHLARYKLADLILDSFPYGAHTTASDALWMGVPVVTLAGRSFASRVCGSLLSAAGLPELVTFSDEDYVAKAVSLGLDSAERDRLKAYLREHRDDCLLFDTPKLVKSLEGLYARMAQDLKKGKLPQPDLGNLEIYQEIAVDLDERGEAAASDYHERYRRELEARSFSRFLRPDPRLWK